MERRTLLQSPLALGVSALLAAAPTGCNRRAAEASPSDEPRVRKVLLAYFSRAGENYYNGGRTNLAVGNTHVAAQLISSSLGCDVYEILAADPYPTSYDATVERNRAEQENDARPAIAGALPAIDAYDTVLLGSPIWNVKPPMIMRTFVEGLDLSGRTIFPFVTYAVSGLGDTMASYQRWAPRATIGDGLAVRGEEVRAAGGDVRSWLDRIGLLEDSADG